MSNSNQPRRISSTTKRPPASENPAKAMASNPGAASHQPKKRPALANLTNRPNAPRDSAGRTAENKVFSFFIFFDFFPFILRNFIGKSIIRG